MFEVSLKTSSVRVRLDAMPDNVRSALATETRTLEEELVSRAKALASGPVLKVLTGRYVKSIKGSVRVSKTRIRGKVWSRDPRAGIFEWGGSTKPHEILPTTAQALAFMTSAGQLFAAAVHHPGSKIAPHSVIHEAFDEMKGDIRAGLVTAAQGAAAAS